MAKIRCHRVWFRNWEERHIWGTVYQFQLYDFVRKRQDVNGFEKRYLNVFVPVGEKISLAELIKEQQELCKNW
jgi:hypothetical protein